MSVKGIKTPFVSNERVCGNLTEFKLMLYYLMVIRNEG
jgi:hypothetical protein